MEESPNLWLERKSENYTSAAASFVRETSERNDAGQQFRVGRKTGGERLAAHVSPDSSFSYDA